MQEIRSGNAWCTISHAENTQQEGLRLLVDWVTCSFFFAGTVADLLQVLGMEELPIDKQKGARYKGYTETYFYDRLEIYLSDKTGIHRKVMLNFSGQGCRIYEQKSSINWISLFACLLNEYKAKFTRLDIAIDDFNQIYQTSTIRNACFKKLCVSRLEDWGNNTEGKLIDGDDYFTMDSFYIGNKRSSRYFLNVYDKKVEREQAGKEVTVQTWTRTELRLKAEYATRFAIQVAQGSESIGYYTMSFLSEKIQFLKPGKYSNRSRSAKEKENISRWWNQFLGSCGKLNLSVKAPDRTLEQVKTWFTENMSSTLAMIADDNPAQFEDAVNAILHIGRNKYKDKHIQLLKHSNTKKSFPKGKIKDNSTKTKYTVYDN